MLLILVGLYRILSKRCARWPVIHFRRLTSPPRAHEVGPLRMIMNLGFWEPREAPLSNYLCRRPRAQGSMPSIRFAEGHEASEGVTGSPAPPAVSPDHG